MTIEDFSNTKFSAGMTCSYRDTKYKIVSVNFLESLIALKLGSDEMWVRCENVTLI